MLPEWMMALLVLLRERRPTRRDAHVRFLKLQVEILRSQLPGNRVIPDPVKRRRLPKAGAEVALGDSAFSVGEPIFRNERYRFGSRLECFLDEPGNNRVGGENRWEEGPWCDHCFSASRERCA